MLDVQIRDLRGSLSLLANSEMGRESKNLEAHSSWCSESSVRSDVWSAKNSLFADYSDVSQRSHLQSKFIDLEHVQQLGHSSKLVDRTEMDNISDNNINISSTTERTFSTPTGNDTSSSRRRNEMMYNSTCKARLSPSCNPLDLSAARYDETSSDSLLKTPAGFYDRCVPFSGPSIPPLFERDETNFSDTARSCSTSSSSSVVTCSSDDLGSTCSTRCSSPSSITDQGSHLSCSTRCSSPCSIADRGSHSATNDESRFCDRLVCSVLSQVISDDFCSDACLLNSISDIEEEDVKSNCSPNSSMLNPLAPAFCAKPCSANSSTPVKTANSGGVRPRIAICSPVQLAYVQQHMVNPVAWSYVPAYYPSSRQSSSRKSKPGHPGLMHYTPLCDGTGVWTQFADPASAYKYPTVVYPGRVDALRHWRTGQQQIYFVPQPCVSFVKVGYPMALPFNNPSPMVRKTRSTTTSSHKGRGSA